MREAMENLIALIIQSLIWVPLRILFFFFGRLKVLNWGALGRVPAKSFIVISNHISFIDPFLVSHLFPFGPRYFPFRYPTAPEHYYSWKRPFMWMLGSYPVAAKIGLERSLEKSLKILGRGGRILAFPEGVINRAYRPKLAHRGVAYLAAKTKTPILPVYIEGFYPEKYKTGFSWREFLGRKYRLKVACGESFFIDRICGKNPENEKEYGEAAEKAMSLVHKLKDALRNL